MVQSYTEDCYDPDHVANTDLVNMENNFLTLRSGFSGASSPSNPVSGLQWFDMTNRITRVRNYSNNGWFSLIHGNSSFKVPLYRNDQDEGWSLVAGISDRVISIKGGNYGASGGAEVGSWSQPDHTLTTAEIPAHTHGSAGAHSHTFTGDTPQYGTTGTQGGYGDILWGGSREYYADVGISTASAHTHASVGSGSSHNHGTAYRPYAAVCTLQHINV